MLAESPANPFVRAKFTGSASEYFGIWIVNVLLTIVTIGIYSAWAKVRRNRYFYGNTVLLGRAFEYHATGKQIFLGRAIVFVGLVIIARSLLRRARREARGSFQNKHAIHPSWNAGPQGRHSEIWGGFALK